MWVASCGSGYETALISFVKWEVLPLWSGEASHAYRSSETLLGTAYSFQTVSGSGDMLPPTLLQTFMSCCGVYSKVSS